MDYGETQIPIGTPANMPVVARTRYTVECHQHFHEDGSRCLSAWDCPDGVAFDDHRHELRWLDGFDNLVVTEGLNELLDRSFDAVAADVNWYVGLKDTGTPVAGDTMASHASWATITPYSNATDPAWTKNGAASAGAMSNSSSKAQFNINATDTIFGAFLKNNNTKGGSTGVLYGVGDFASSRAVINGDTLNVQVDLSVAAA